MQILIILSILASVALAQQYTTPVPILKQINRHNEDGSYSYGYEGADGSFKIETKYANGEVQGKYGYVDDAGKVREVEYGASRRGFEPQGTDINVPPPTINQNNDHAYPLGPNEEDDGQYREDPSIYYKDDKYNTKPVQSYKAPAPAYNNNNQQNYNSGPRQYYQQNYVTEPPQYNNNNYQQPQQHPQYQQYNQQPAQQKYDRGYNQNYNNFNGHPATNFDLNTGSYSLTYTG